MAWMKIELELPDKTEVHGIASITGLDPDAVVGKLIRVWQWFDKHTVDGNAFGVTFSLVDRLTHVIGFGEAMMFVGWLEQNDKYLKMPKFDKHTSASAKKRADSALRQSDFKEKQRLIGEGSTNAKVTQQALPSALPREEKEKEIKTKASAFALPDWVPVDAWKGFEEMRVRVKKPLTDRARSLALTELEKICDAGHSAETVIDLATMNSWLSFYAPKVNGKHVAAELTGNVL